MAMFKNYDPGKVTASFGGVMLSGFAKGSMISVERNDDTYKIKEGGTGDVTRVRNRSKSGRITFTLMAESPANDLLSAVFVADEQFGTGVYPVTVRNLLGTTKVFAANAWIVKAPKVGYGGEETDDVEWILECDELQIFAGGSVV